MEVFVRGQGKVHFSKDDFASSGGEAKIYKKGGISYKIFHSSNKMIPEAKINELQVLTKSNIVKPIEILLNKKNTPIGFTSQWVNGIPLCKIFVSGFRKRNGITDNHTNELVKRIKETIQFIHQKQCLMVDGNEMNYLVGDDYVTPYFIDVNSWKTPNFPATALMDSIKDWLHPNKFTEYSDWYAFAIISCWLFVGIHPFRGNHPDYVDTDIHKRTEKRTIDKVSIFHPDVLLAPNARMANIPNHYKDWYMRIFNGERSLPPSEAGTIVAVPIDITIIKGTDNFEIHEIKSYKNDIVWFCKIEGKDIAKTLSSIYINQKEVYVLQDTNVIFSTKKQIPVFSIIKDSKLQLSSMTSDIRKMTNPKATETMIIGNHLYYRYQGNLVEMIINEHSTENKVIPIVKHIWPIMPNSSTIFAGIIFQNILGIPYISIPIPRNDKASSFISKKIPELEGHKILDAKHDNNVVAIYSIHNGTYKILILRFSKDYTKYDIREIICSDVGDINLITLDQGVSILIPENGILEVFGNCPFINDVKSICDSIITTDMRLCKDGTKAMFIKDKSLYTITMN